MIHFIYSTPDHLWYLDSETNKYFAIEIKKIPEGTEVLGTGEKEYFQKYIDEFDRGCYEFINKYQFLKYVDKKFIFKHTETGELIYYTNFDVFMMGHLTCVVSSNKIESTGTKMKFEMEHI